MSAFVKVFGCRPTTDVVTYTGGRRTKTSKGGNRDGWEGRRRARPMGI